MAGTPVWRASDEAAFSTRIKRGGTRVPALLPVLVIGALLVARPAMSPARPYVLAAGASSNDPAALLVSAADRLEAVTAPGGRGYSFRISQTSTITARPNGPKIDVPDPIDPHKSLGLADTYLFYSLIERGTARPDGFWSELRTGPQPGEAADFEKAELRRSALVKDGVAWRNDRQGWYQADHLPGIGLDPETAALLPRLLRNATEPTGKGDIIVDGATLTLVAASGTETDVPGLVAANGAAYTRITGPIDFGVDDPGRLAWIHAVALNTTMADYDLVVDTTIDLIYDEPGPLPDPDPIWLPTAAPQEEGG